MLCYGHFRGRIGIFSSYSKSVMFQSQKWHTLKANWQQKNCYRNLSESTEEYPECGPGHQHHDLISQTIILSWCSTKQDVSYPIYAECLARLATSINFICHWFDSAQNQNPDLPHKEACIYQFGYCIQSPALIGRQHNQQAAGAWLSKPSGCPPWRSGWMVVWSLHPCNI